VEQALSGMPDGRLDDAFSVQLIHRLWDQGPEMSPALAWLEERLALRDKSVDGVVRKVHRRQGAANVSVRNIITSLRLISDVDWQELVEQSSPVDDVLAADSFRAMDFPTRNLYRTAIEELARGSSLSEVEIARRAVRAASAAQMSGDGPDPLRKGDVGYHLIAGGRSAFEASIDFHPPLRNWLARLNRSLGISGYAGAIVISAAALLAVALIGLGASGASITALWLTGILGVIPVIDVAVMLINRAVTTSFGASRIPALELKEGIPAELRTMVAVPILLTSAQTVEEQVEHLEIHYLASPQGDLHFALLSDWLDADNEHAECDDILLAAAQRGIDRLNARYGPAPGGGRFFLLHRRRSWSESEGRWIGWERKRGKLHELNRLLRGAQDTHFIGAEMASALPPPGIRYVVTLDADTRLPRDSLRRLIGKMAHPLNRPRIDTSLGRIVEGYGILQPRVTPSLPVGREGSWLQRIFSSLSGIDPYAATVSDVYQDLFGEGSYAGKGIYEVDAFEAVLADRVPEATLLSHDLFEGIFARSGLASDVEVVEDYPARYDSGARRYHRWARGDWQLLPWIIGGWTARSGSGPFKGAMPAIGRW
jgi:cyclic beta-1,2-glucan synthetase